MRPRVAALFISSLCPFRVRPVLVVQVDDAEGVGYGYAQEQPCARCIPSDLGQLVFVVENEEFHALVVEMAEILFLFDGMGEEHPFLFHAPALYQLELSDGADVEASSTFVDDGDTLRTRVRLDRIEQLDPGETLLEGLIVPDQPTFRENKQRSAELPGKLPRFRET